jgi:Mg2+-importing ATPase
MSLRRRAGTIPNRSPIDRHGRNDARGLPEELAHWRGLSLPELFRALHASRRGLDSPDAASRLDAVGPNLIGKKPRLRLAFAFFERFRNPLVLVLLGAAAVSAFTGDAASFFIISFVVACSVVLDVVQEHRAQSAAERLREQVSITAMVMRDGRPTSLPTSRIVPGDVILLSAGDLVPADARLIEAEHLYVNQALLTGESFPAEKRVGGRAAPVRDGGEPDDVVFMGSSVVSGTARALVVATGRAAELGRVATSLQREPPPTAFTLGLRDFGFLIVQLTVGLVLFVLFVNLLFHRPLLESFLFALALAVGLTPELLPMIVSVTLAHGALRLSKADVIVKRLSAIHDLGAMDILCSDKTGTLTEAHIALVRTVDLEGHDSARAMRLGRLNAAFETGIKSPLDEAILEAGAIDLETWRKIDEVPFDFERRRVSILAEGEGRRLLVVKGAPEDVLALSSRYEADAAASSLLDSAARALAGATFDKLGSEGFRVLAVAWREVEPDREHAAITDERELIFAGFLAFLDPPKPDAKAALDSLHGLGVGVKILTGDNERVTRHVCAELGIPIGKTLIGPEIAALGDEALAARLEETTLFCRVTPQQKSRIIAALRQKGHVVGYIGDGINDAPSLHIADIGFSVDTAADVAKEAACMILLRKDLGVLAQGVREGRRTFANILKYIMMGTSSNVGNMFSMAGGVLFLPFLPMLPVQILVNNLLYDLSESGIPMDRVDAEMVARPRRWDLSVIRKFMIVLGPISSAFDFVTFGLLLTLFDASEPLFQTAWFVESIATQVLVIFIIRTAHPFRDPPHPLLAATSILVVCIAVALPFTPIGAWLGFVAVPVPLLLALAAVTLVYLGAVYVVRQWFFVRHGLA